MINKYMYVTIFSQQQKNLLIYDRQKGVIKNNFFPNSLYNLYESIGS